MNTLPVGTKVVITKASITCEKGALGEVVSNHDQHGLKFCRILITGSSLFVGRHTRRRYCDVAVR